MKNYVGAIDQGTTSTRFMVFDKDAHVVAVLLKRRQGLHEVGFLQDSHRCRRQQAKALFRIDGQHNDNIKDEWDGKK